MTSHAKAGDIVMNGKQSNENRAASDDGQDKASLDEKGLHRDREKWMGEQLRRVYDDVVNEPIPDDLQKLIDKLDNQQSDKGGPDDR